MSGEKAKDIFWNIIDPFLENLINEIKAQDGYNAWGSDWNPGPTGGEANGITKQYPNGTQKTVYVFWPDGGHSILVGLKGAVGGSGKFPLDDFNETEFKKRIQAILK